MVINGISEKIKELLKENNWTNQDLADNLDLGIASVVRLMSNNDVKKLETFVKLCEVFEVSPAYLLSEVTGNYKDRRTQGLMRTVVEVDYEDFDEEKRKAFVVPMYDELYYTFIPFDFDKITKDHHGRMGIREVRLPYFFASGETKWEIYGRTIPSGAIPLYFTGMVDHDRYFMSKIRDASEIENGKMYLTINSVTGKSIDFLTYNHKTEEVHYFFDMELENIKDSVHIGKIYEIWKLVAVLRKPFSNELYSEPEDITFRVD